MTEEQFRNEALRLGFSKNAIECQIRLQSKLRSEGLPPVSYEDVLAAKREASCIHVFEHQQFAQA